MRAVSGQTQPPPSMSDILTAMSVMTRPQTPAAPPEGGMAKHAASVVVAVILALCLWVGASVYTLNTTTTQVATKLDGMQKTLDEVSARQDATVNRMSDIQAQQAKQDGRVTAIEQDNLRLRERMRLVEGQKPLGMPPAP